MRGAYLVFLAVSWACMSSSQAQHRFSSADRQAIAALFEAQRQAWNRGDLEGFMAGYENSPELIFTSGAQIRRGFDETLARYRARYGSRPDTMGTLHFELLDLRGLGADGAVVLGNWQLEGSASAGRGVFTVVLERTERSWKIVHDHTSSAAEPR